jgi:hypothetical protein
MDTNQAAEHLGVIRTLMERSALYRRALAPVTTLAGDLGTLAAAAGFFLRFETPVIFTGFWLAVGLLTATSALLLIRQQALRQKESFWTSPTRRVTQAMLPPLLIGFVIGILLLSAEMKAGTPSEHHPEASADLTWLPLTWIVLYGCALHAAGFFTPRSLRYFGWAFILGGASVLIYWVLFGFHTLHPQLTGHLIMGAFFGVAHLAYGTLLAVTERKQTA